MKYFVPSVDYSAKILIFLSRYKNRQSTLTEISSNLGINKSACFRILKTLETNNFVYYNAEIKKYSLGYYISVLGERVSENSDYLVVVNKYLEECSNETGCTAALLQRVSFDRVMFISQRFPEGFQKLKISVGNKFPLTEVSYGKWVLSQMNEEGRTLVLKEGLKQVTPYTVTDINVYKAQLEQIRLTNVLVSREEYTPEVLAISSGLYDWRGRLLGIMVLMDLAKIVDSEKEQQLVSKLKKITEKCNSDLVNMRIEANEYPYDLES